MHMHHGVFKGLNMSMKWCTPKNYIFWNLLCMLFNVGGAKEIRKFGQHLQPGHYYALLFVPRYKYAQMYCNFYNAAILTFKTPRSTNLGSRNWFLVSQYCQYEHAPQFIYYLYRGTNIYAYVLYYLKLDNPNFLISFAPPTLTSMQRRFQKI